MSMADNLQEGESGIRVKRGEKVRREKRLVGGMGRKDFEGKTKVEINDHYRGTESDEKLVYVCGELWIQQRQTNN